MQLQNAVALMARLAVDIFIRARFRLLCIATLARDEGDSRGRNHKQLAKSGSASVLCRVMKLDPRHAIRLGHVGDDNKH